VECIDADRVEDASEELRGRLRDFVPDGQEIFIDAARGRGG
jgi:hypothetical protein